VLEAAAVGALGMAAAFAIYAVLGAVIATVIRNETGVVLDLWAPHPIMWQAPLGMIVLCALGGLAPAWKAYRTDVADNLAPAS
jgi:putative ABC transport system permease protein